MSSTSDNNINPFESPRTPSEAAFKGGDIRQGRLTAWLTRIVGFPVGVNVLGLLEFFALVGVMFVSLALMERDMRAIAVVVLPIGALGIISFDLWWRHGQPESASWARLLSPYAGGCFAFVPIWLLFLASGCAMVIMVIVKSA